MSVLDDQHEQWMRLIHELTLMPDEQLWQLKWWLDPALENADSGGDLEGEALVWAQRWACLVELEIDGRGGDPAMAHPDREPTPISDRIPAVQGAAPFGVALSLEMLEALHEVRVATGKVRRDAIKRAQNMATDPAHFWLSLIIPAESESESEEVPE